MFHRSILALIVLLVAETVQAQVFVTNPENRIWTDNTGKHQVNAKLIEIKSREIRLKRSDDQRELSMPIAKLSPADVKYVREVRRLEQQISSLLNEASSLDKFLDRINPLIDRYNEPGPANETSVQSERRESQRENELIRAIENQSFTLFLEAADVRQVSTDLGIEAITSPHTIQDQLAVKRSTFDIDIQSKEYPVTLPKTFRVFAGAAQGLKKGSYFCLKCKFPSMKGERDVPTIGTFKMGYRDDFTFTVSIVEFIVPPNSMPDSVFTRLKNSAPKSQESKFNPLEMTREDFRKAFFRIDGASKNAISIILKEDLHAAFGGAHRIANIDSTQYLTYRCKDGVVNLIIQANADAVIPDGHILILSIEDY
jgi:hypothetical protein